MNVLGGRVEGHDLISADNLRRGDKYLGYLDLRKAVSMFKDVLRSIFKSWIVLDKNRFILL